MKYFFLTFCSTFFLPLIAFAQSGVPITYTLMAPLTGYLSGTPTLSQYLQGVVQVTIGIAGILAVIMLIYCGIKLMGTPSASAKSEAKECIWNAIFGVLLAIGAWILLYTINPLLLSSDLLLTDVERAPAAAAQRGPVTEPYPINPGWYFKYSDNTGTHYGPPGGTRSAEMCASLLAPAEAAGKTIIEVNGQRCFQVPEPGRTISQGELATRVALCGNNSCVGSKPIGINNQPCPYVGAKGCTNVGGLPSLSIQTITGLQAACSCNVVVSGGTEYWLHGNRSLNPPNSNSAHAPGNDVFDLSKTPKLDQVIKTGEKKASFQNYWRWLYNGFWYTDEGNHWHVCKDGLSASYCRQ